MTELAGKIKGIKYSKSFHDDLPEMDFNSNINEWNTRCCVNYNGILYSVSKWVSPKRTRSYPYSRVYDTYNICGGKTVTIIPIVKDEGADGDMDYLQWDTISLMSLLNVYVILGYYADAEVNKRRNVKPNKITMQKFDDEYIKEKFQELSEYHSSSLHWNVDQLKINNLNLLMDKVIKSYANISIKTGIKLHKTTNLENFKDKITYDLNSFMSMSRAKAKQAQNREYLTIQPKEILGKGVKTKIEIENYLGGNYFFTIDDVLINDNTYKLIESKHSNSSLMPSLDDIKDGLLKMIVYSNINELKNVAGSVNFKPALRLTSTKIKGFLSSDICSEEQINHFIKNNKFSKQNIEIILKLVNEAQNNNFELIIEQV